MTADEREQLCLRIRLAGMGRCGSPRLELPFRAGISWERYTTALPGLTGLVFLLFESAVAGMAIALGG
jgi:hypothetical protein